MSLLCWLFGHKPIDFSHNHISLFPWDDIGIHAEICTRCRTVYWVIEE